jgi:ABC-2 type transport system ATP-binding protein
LDEPFESIDPAGVALMKEWLRQFVARGRTVFLTTHVLETVERLCEEVAIITRPGRLLWQGGIRSLATDGAISARGRRFRTLEELFLSLTGGREATISWV